MSEPRAGLDAQESGIAAVLLAAGLSARYRARDRDLATKLVALYRGKPLVRHVAEAALASRAAPLIVVTGHAQERVREALADLPAQFVHNRDYASGLASSLRTGLAAVPPAARGALVLLADMPAVRAHMLDREICVFAAHPTCSAVVPLHRGRPGNPVLLARRIFADLAGASGDRGAGAYLRSRTDVMEWEVEDEAVVFDVDEPAGLNGPI